VWFNQWDTARKCEVVKGERTDEMAETESVRNRTERFEVRKNQQLTEINQLYNHTGQNRAWSINWISLLCESCCTHSLLLRIDVFNKTEPHRQESKPSFLARYFKDGVQEVDNNPWLMFIAKVRWHGEAFLQQKPQIVFFRCLTRTLCAN